MRDFWVVCDLATGVALYNGEGDAGTAAIQKVQMGRGVFLLPGEEAINDDASINLDVLREFYQLKIDAAAEAQRQHYIIPPSGQAMTYQEKKEEALAWKPGSDPSKFTFLKAEADATGKSIDEIAAEVLGAASAWKPLGAAIEAARRAAKQAVTLAETIPQIAAASEIPWPQPQQS